jgi:hypothetical protein
MFISFDKKGTTKKIKHGQGRKIDYVAIASDKLCHRKFEK